MSDVYTLFCLRSTYDVNAIQNILSDASRVQDCWNLAKIHCLLLPPLLSGDYVRSLFCCALLSIVTIFAITSLGKREREMVALL